MVDCVYAHPDFDWDSFYGENGSILAEVVAQYKYLLRGESFITTSANCA